MFVVSFCELAKTLKVNGSYVQEFVTFMKVNVFLFYLLCIYHNLRVVFSCFICFISLSHTANVFCLLCMSLPFDATLTATM